MGGAAQGGYAQTWLPSHIIIGSATRTSASANDVSRKHQGMGLTVPSASGEPGQKMALVAKVFIAAPDVRIPNLAIGWPMKPYAVTRTD